MKRTIRYVSEIIFAFVLIFVSYFAWDRIDVDAYEKYITQYNYEDIVIDISNDFSELSYLSDESKVNNTILYINNYQNKTYNTDILLILNGILKEDLNNFYLSIDGNKYNLEDIYLTTNGNDYYFLISNINLKEYEKVNYNLKLLVDDNFDFSKFNGFSYKIQEEIKG